MTQGKAVPKPIPREWYLWDGTEETEARINAWATPENRTDTDVWFSAITRVKGEYIYGDRMYTAEVYDFLHSRWIPLKTGWYVMKAITGECWPMAADIFKGTQDITEEI